MKKFGTRHHSGRSLVFAGTDKEEATMPFLQNQICHFVSYKTPGQQKIFIRDRDYRFFIYLLKKHKKFFKIKIFGFCLLPSAVYLIFQTFHPSSPETPGDARRGRRKNESPATPDSATKFSKTGHTKGPRALPVGLHNDAVKKFINALQESYASYYQKYQDARGPAKQKGENAARFWPRSSIKVIIRNDKALCDYIKYVEFIPVLKIDAASPISYPWSSCSLRVLGKQNGILDAETF